MCSFQGTIPWAWLFAAHAFRKTLLVRFRHGDEGIRTPDPLLARQVLSQLSYTPRLWQPPALPCRLQHSTIGRLGLNHRVRDGYGCSPQAHRHQKLRDACCKCTIQSGWLWEARFLKDRWIGLYKRRLPRPKGFALGRTYTSLFHFEP